MSYSNDITQIRAGLVNYIGAMLKTMNYTERANKQLASSVMIEESMTLAQGEDGVYDPYVLKPMIRGMILLLKQRCEELSKLPKNEQVTAQIAEYTSAISTLENLVAVLK